MSNVLYNVEKAKDWYLSRWLRLQSEVSDAKAYWTTPWFAVPHDGNPIFTAICQFEKRGLRIIEYTSHPNSDNSEQTGIGLCWYFDYFANGSLEEIHELVVDCHNHILAREIAFVLAEQWIRYGNVNLFPFGGEWCVIDFEKRV